MKPQYRAVCSVRSVSSQKRQLITNGPVIRELWGSPDRKIEVTADDLRPENGTSKTWRALAKYFCHGLGFSLLVFFLTYESMVFNSGAETLPLIPVLLIMGLVGVALLVIMMGIVNTALTTRLWFQVETSFWSMMLHGIALIVPLWIVSVPFFLVYFTFPSVATILAVTVFQAFVDGFVCKRVAETWRKSVLSTAARPSATE